MSLLCALSGVAPEHPVYSSTGYIFERRVIEKHLEDTKVCPISGRELNVEDLSDIQQPKIARPRPATATSVPGLLTLLQNEWDSTMAEMFTLRQHVDQVRTQLTQSLYQHDASCRVIARVVRERDAAQSRVAQLQKRLGDAEDLLGSGGGLHGEAGLPDEDFNKVVQLSVELPKRRRNRDKSPPYDASTLSSMSCVGSFPLHSTTNPGVLCCAVDKTKSTNLIATGGVDGHVVVFDVRQKKTRSRLVGHIKGVNRVAFHDTEHLVISASEDKTARVWKLASEADADLWNYSCAHVIRKHMGALTGLDMHPTGSFFATSAKDHSWALHDLGSGNTIWTLNDLPTNYSCIKFHPDGALFAGADYVGNFEVWDMKDKKPSTKIASLKEHNSEVKSIAFSENGINVATASLDGTVCLWDLRKPAMVQSISPGSSEDMGDVDVDMTTNQTSVHAVSYDYSANYLAVAASDVISLYETPKKGSATFNSSLMGHSALVTDLSFGPRAEFLVSTSMDRTVKIWEPK